MWKNKAISKAIKVKVHETMVLSILCYNSEMWTLTYKLNRQLRAFEMGCLWRILNITRRDHLKNSDSKTKLDIKMILWKKSHLKDVVRMDNCHLSNIALYGRVEGCRARGRPRKSWLDNIIEDCKRRRWGIIEATHLANNRLHWRTSIRLSQRATASP